MRWRLLIWLWVSALFFAVCFWRLTPEHPRNVGTPAGTVNAAPRAGIAARTQATESPAADPRFPYRLANTPRTIDDLTHSDHALLLENALLDTLQPVNLPFPDFLRRQGPPGSYIVQCRPATDPKSFLAFMDQAGARCVSFIPNNAYLVRATDAVAARLQAGPLTQSILPYEPYYKLKSALLALAVEQTPLTGDSALNLLLFADERLTTMAELQKLGAAILAESRSPFGPVVTVRPPPDSLAALARISGVQALELAHLRVPSTDLTRVAAGVAPNPLVSSNYLGLTGTNVLLTIADTGVDTNHPDLAGRVTSDLPPSGHDFSGHGTHVAGIIAGSGLHSATVTNAPGSPMPGVAGQFRGLAPRAALFSLSFTNSDSYLQESAARTNALISNNSWNYNVSDYDFAAASYDAAVRDALPEVPGSQPMLFVFSTGNAGAGNTAGGGGTPGSILSPATAKNVLTVGALEQRRNITNRAWLCSTNGPGSCQTNQPWLGSTDATNQVAAFSSRGNVGAGIEGAFGRFKPDLVAPGTFVVSARSGEWEEASYYTATNPFLVYPEFGNSIEVLSNLNNSLGPAPHYYRYESGTSLAAAAVSGALALIHEFFGQRLGRTNSPALMKALVINGARSAGPLYDFHVQTATNFQGWGLLNLPNSLPGVLSNLNSSAGTPSSLLVLDQSPSTALATGQARTRFLSLTPAAQALPLRITLVWTDPPGNPMAGLKLVNNLDLLVTNLDTGEVYFGNDILAGQDFNEAWDTNASPNLDSVNNVENVFLTPRSGALLSTNYSVTVLGRRVNVNAVTAQTNAVLQDFALVISSGDGQVSDGLAFTDAPPVLAAPAWVTPLPNLFGALGDTNNEGGILLGQRVGSENPLSATNSPTVSVGNGQLTLGTLNPWHFYVLTNDTDFTNAVFLTFSPHRLAASPLDFQQPQTSNLALAEPDLDLYVSTDQGLTNLDPAVLANAFTSLGRGGAETIVLSNATPGTFYIGVKCESQSAAEFGLLGLISELPFSAADTNGNQLLRGFPAPLPIPDASPRGPGLAQVFAVSPQPMMVRRVVVTNVLSHELMADLVGSLSHGDVSVVLNNRATNGPVHDYPFIYDDSAEANVPGAQPSAGPGSLRDFAGARAAGQWLLTQQDENPGHRGTNVDLSIFLEAQPDLTAGVSALILPGACREDHFEVPPEGTNLLVTAALTSGAGPILMQVCPPDGGNSCQATWLTNASASSLMLDKTSHPPLNAGRYVVRFCNQSSAASTVNFSVALVVNPSGVAPATYNSSSPVSLLDGAVSSSSIVVTNSSRIDSLSVGVRLDHPRISDLRLDLVSPAGTRVVLCENRGGTSTNGMGLNTIQTNMTPVSSSGGVAASVNEVDTGQTSGLLTINYSFYALPDQMRIYYENNLIFDSGMTSYSGIWLVHYGPGTSTRVTIIMNEGGNGDPNTAWDYVLTSSRAGFMYTTFTENTNLTVTPVKFAPPPFTQVTTLPNGSPAGGFFVLPEESLDRFAGQNAQGKWKLEIWDSRAGAILPPPTLVSWQLQIVVANDAPAPIPLAPTLPWTNTVPPGQFQCFIVDVPAWANFATNSLLSASAPLRLWFNQYLTPTGTNAGDVILLPQATSGRAELSATNGLPALLAGARYYLGVLNTNTTPVTFVVQVDFDVTPLTNAVPVDSSLAAGRLPQYFSFDVSTNAAAVSFLLENLSGDVDLVASRGLPFPSSASSNYRSLNPGTNDESVVVTTNSVPVPLSPGRWYLGVYNSDTTNITYRILATEFSAAATNLVIRSVTLVPGGFQMRWLATPATQFQVQWTPTLAPPAWNTIPGNIYSPTGYFLFLDDGSQTGGLDTTRFYRLLRVP
jgi:subtilisin family serine protease/subtilisin-like proprotein convertase family protein